MKRRKRFVFLGSLILIVLLCGCSSKSSSSNQKASAVESAVESEKLMDNKSFDTTGEEVNLTLNNNLNRKVIKTGELRIETKAFEETINSIFEKVEAIEGFVESSYVEGNSYHRDTARRSAEVKVRIPNKAFDGFINGADTFGNVTARSMKGEDVTDTYVDTEARLRSLEVRRTRLMELLEKSGTLEELFAIEKEVADVSYEIEQLQGTLNKYDSLIDYSTVSIYIDEVQIYQNTQKANTFEERISKRFDSSIQSLRSLGEDAIVLVVGLVPFMLIIGIPVAIVVIILFIRKKKKINENRDREEK